MSETYKEQFIQELTKEILQLDKNNQPWDAVKLRKARKMAKEIHGREFIPGFPDKSANFLAMKMITDAYYYNKNLKEVTNGKKF